MSDPENDPDVEDDEEGDDGRPAGGEDFDGRMTLFRDMPPLPDRRSRRILALILVFIILTPLFAATVFYLLRVLVQNPSAGQ